MHSSQTHIRPRPGSHPDGKATSRTERAESSDTGGTIDVGWGSYALQADTHSLTLRAAVADQDSLQHLQHLMIARPQKIGERDALQVIRQQDETTDGQPMIPPLLLPPRRRKPSPTTTPGDSGAIAVLALIVAVHVPSTWAWAGYLAEASSQAARVISPRGESPSGMRDRSLTWAPKYGAAGSATTFRWSLRL